MYKRNVYFLYPLICFAQQSVLPSLISDRVEFLRVDQYDAYYIKSLGEEMMKRANTGEVLKLFFWWSLIR